ncbi:MAG: hypothetical protein EOP56_02660 [Sphingobacteriales bacterium]|nr:MAG: hypothetical protein EOP56_02660 [Sphingobacteriales bacterium]
MEHYFNLPVVLEGQEMELSARLQTFGYTFRYYIIVDKQEVVFERDGEMKFRALSKGIANMDAIPVPMLQAIADSLEAIAK